LLSKQSIVLVYQGVLTAVAQICIPQDTESLAIFYYSEAEGKEEKAIAATRLTAGSGISKVFTFM
jgi:hypothetical protein